MEKERGEGKRKKEERFADVMPRVIFYIFNKMHT
jgi:hypothetical protein